MKNIKMVVLTKSLKYGKYCVAGIDINNGNWVRLVTEDEESHGAVSNKNLISKDKRIVNVLDIIDVPVIKKCNDTVQPENVLLDLDRYIEIKGKMEIDEVLTIHPLENWKFIFGNNYCCISEKKIGLIKCSLILIKVFNLFLYPKKNADGKDKTKASFVYNGNIYENIAVTDSNFYNFQLGDYFEEAILVMSVGSLPFHEHYYKFIAAIFVDLKLNFDIEFVY